MPYLQTQGPNMITASADSHMERVGYIKAPQMAVQPLDDGNEMPDTSIPHIDLCYDSDNSEQSARELVYRIQPKWRDFPTELEFTKFTDGITNTLLRITRREPGATQEDIDDEAILMRAYGNNTDLIIDRDREARSHALLAERGMAPALLSRFNNGLLYRYVPGKPCSADDLTRERVWRGVARKLAEWHARVPISAVSSTPLSMSNGTNGHVNGVANGYKSSFQTNDIARRSLKTRHPEPNFWSVLQKWVDALPTSSEKNIARKKLLQQEIERTFEELDSHHGIGEYGFVFGHLDLLSGNVIMLPTKPDATSTPSEPLPVTFIDYEYATPCPAAFDIANHFAEWAGFDLDYSRIPTKSVRRAFLVDYVASYNQCSPKKISETYVDTLEEDVNRWRGIPGLYWGIWALIQATISEIDFDYADYAEQRLNEYWAWRAELDGSRVRDGKTISPREQRWAQDH